MSLPIDADNFFILIIHGRQEEICDNDGHLEARQSSRDAIQKEAHYGKESEETS